MHCTSCTCKGTWILLTASSIPFYKQKETDMLKEMRTFLDIAFSWKRKIIQQVSPKISNLRCPISSPETNPMGIPRDFHSHAQSHLLKRISFELWLKTRKLWKSLIVSLLANEVSSWCLCINQCEFVVEKQISIFSSILLSVVSFCWP